MIIKSHKKNNINFYFCFLVCFLISYHSYFIECLFENIILIKFINVAIRVHVVQALDAKTLHNGILIGLVNVDLNVKRTVKVVTNLVQMILNTLNLNQNVVTFVSKIITLDVNRSNIDINVNLRTT